MVGIRADDIFADSTLAKIKRVTDGIAKVQGVLSVASITNAPDPAEDVVNLPRLLPRSSAEQGGARRSSSKS